MRYGDFDHRQTGIFTPLSALRSRAQCGAGEFADLPLLAEWAAEAGFDLIQILPVQDTGDDPSPYAARSAFALHPVYLRPSDLEGAEALLGELRECATHFATRAEFDYAQVYSRKLALLHRIFERLDPVRLWSEAEAFIRDNPWLRAYAAYVVYRERYLGRSWRQWPAMRAPSADDLDRLWDARPTDLLFQVWLQQNADRQLRQASAAVASLGIRLKGDLPILCQEDGSDVWYQRHYFDLNWRAGAPPDMYAENGQLWGFPCYRWDALADDDYAWWRARLRQASRYFHALRIDHVLGFFRIWQVPESSRTGMLGHFDPAVPIERAQLREAGLSDERIDVLAAVEGRVGERFPTEAEYWEIEDQEERTALLRRLWNRVLLDPDGRGERFHPFCRWYDTPLFHSLPEHERAIVGRVIEENGALQDPLWERTGRQRLRMIGDSTDALVCGEDLGAVPPSVPRVLHDLGVLGLRVERWCRRWNEEGQPFIDPSDYPRDSVCSPGVHDASSLRAWWEEDEGDRWAYWRALGRDGAPPPHMDTELLQTVLERNLRANSQITVLALPDVLALDAELRSEDPRRERINVPGTESANNWKWRMPTLLESLPSREGWSRWLREAIDRRRKLPY